MQSLFHTGKVRNCFYVFQFLLGTVMVCLGTKILYLSIQHEPIPTIVFHFSKQQGSFQ